MKDCGTCLVCKKGVDCGRGDPCLNMVEFGGDGKLGGLKCILRVYITPIVEVVANGVTMPPVIMDKPNVAHIVDSARQEGTSKSSAVSQRYDSGVESQSDNNSMLGNG